MNRQTKNAIYRPKPIIELLLTLIPMISAVVKFEWDLLLDRTHGITRAKTVAKRFGRPSALNEEQQLSVITRISARVNISAISQELNTPR
ncbi:hypothetical protein [Serratia liquefaciens]|uniref:hypothetical protein n=1 Tax=Serratia liquefaciens TaxID=614 RepID=UPI00102222A4